MILVTSKHFVQLSIWSKRGFPTQVGGWNFNVPTLITRSKVHSLIESLIAFRSTFHKDWYSWNLVQALVRVQLLCTCLGENYKYEQGRCFCFVLHNPCCQIVWSYFPWTCISFCVGHFPSRVQDNDHIVNLFN